MIRREPTTVAEASNSLRVPMFGREIAFCVVMSKGCFSFAHRTCNLSLNAPTTSFEPQYNITPNIEGSAVPTLRALFGHWCHGHTEVTSQVGTTAWIETQSSSKA